MRATRRSTGVCLLCRHGLSSSNNVLRSKPVATLPSRRLHIQKQPGHDKRRSSQDFSRTGRRDQFLTIRRGKDAPVIFDKLFGRHGQDRKAPFPTALDKGLRQVYAALRDAPIVKYLEKEGMSFHDTFEKFKERYTSSHRGWGREERKFADEIRAEYHEEGLEALQAKLKYGFYGFVTGLRFTESDINNQRAVADLRYPAEWFPQTRKLQRKVHLHVGPTNSGKTYHALKSLEAADTGMYAGPLRLLAHEVYSRMNAKGKKCALVTGEERRVPDDDIKGTGIVSCTVEMMNVNHTVDVAVIDEIQMLGNEDRGWAWTQALLGVKAKELHLCGEARTVPLIKEICASVGEKPIIHEYERLSPLKMDSKSLDGQLKGLRKGDCIVSFSVMGIHALRKAVEAATGKRVATVYGSLPPETRAQQARLFNEPDNDYDFLVASDAIGMGLNLSIKRIIFETTMKWDGTARRTLDVASIKQIAGRAGRYKTAQDDTVKSEHDEDVAAAKGESAEDVHIAAEENVTKADDSLIKKYQPAPHESPYLRALALANPGADPSNPPKPPPNDPSNIGLVTTLEKYDFPIVAKALEQNPPSISQAGLFFPASVVDRFAQYFPPGTPFSYVLLRLSELSQLNTRFQLCSRREALWIADLIEPVRDLSISDRMVFCASPAGRTDNDLWMWLIPALAKCVEQQSGGALYDVAEMPLELLDKEVTSDRNYLRQLERLHKAIVMYLWLSYRFAGIFSTRPLALEVKRWVEERIEKVLEGLSLEDERQRMARRRERDMKLAEEERQRAEMAAADVVESERIREAMELFGVQSTGGLQPTSEETITEDSGEVIGTEEQSGTMQSSSDQKAEVDDDTLLETDSNDGPNGELLGTPSPSVLPLEEEAQPSGEHAQVLEEEAKSLEEEPQSLENEVQSFDGEARSIDGEAQPPLSGSSKPSGLGAQLEIPKHLHDAIDTGTDEMGKDAITRP